MINIYLNSFSVFVIKKKLHSHSILFIYERRKEEKRRIRLLSIFTNVDKVRYIKKKLHIHERRKKRKKKKDENNIDFYQCRLLTLISA